MTAESSEKKKEQLTQLITAYKFDQAMTKEAAQQLVDWYDEHCRDLPWRTDPLPYKVWVSEIMLQQTRVEAVKPYYQRFLQSLPNVQALADCPEDQLLKLWEGLGYYSRVRNMQKAAQMIMEEYHGIFPNTLEQLLKLPGIGSYTAGAISSIAFSLPEPAVDGNVMRVMSRLNADAQNILEPTVKEKVYHALKEAIPIKHPGKFNQAMMDLGAMICLPKGSVLCHECPISGVCRAYAMQAVEKYPVRIKAQTRRLEERTVLVIRDGVNTVLHKRADKGLLAGMYEFPCMDGQPKQNEIIAFMKEIGVSPIHIAAITDAKHIFTHKEWLMHGYMILAEDLSECHFPDHYIAVDVKDTEHAYAIPSAYKAYSAYLQMKIGHERIKEL